MPTLFKRHLSHPRPRLSCAALSALAGGGVAMVMHSGAGGTLARHLPNAPLFHICAIVGAGIAGALIADGFGRGRAVGHVLGAVACVICTALGAILGAMLAMAFQMTGRSVGFSEGIEGAVFLGSIAMVDGLTTSVPVAITWVGAMIGVHLAMSRARRGPY